VCPEVVGPISFERGESVEILQLGKREEGRCLDNIDAKDFCKTMMVQIKGVLKRKKTITVRFHDSSVLDHVNVLGWPASCYVADNNLLEERPVPGEAYKERGRLVHVRRRRDIPCWDGRKVAGGLSFRGEGEVVDDGRRLCRLWFVDDFGYFCGC